MSEEGKSAERKTITINCTTERLAESITNFLQKFNPNIVQSIAGELHKKHNAESDPAIVLDKDATEYIFNATEVVTDKGKVLILPEGATEFVTCEYTTLAPETRYMTWERDFFLLFVKKEDDSLDANLGWFNGFQQAVEAFNTVGMPETTDTPQQEVVMEVER